MKKDTVNIFAAAFLTAAAACGPAQTADNLSHPAGYETAPLGSLGPVVEAGEGGPPVVLIPDALKNAEAYPELVEFFSRRHKVYLPVAAGVGGSAAPPMPDDVLEYGERPWTAAYEQAVINLAEEEGLSGAVLVGHFSAAASAMRIAKQRPDLFARVLILSGEFSRSPPQHAAGAEKWAQNIATRLWKDISQQGWNEGMYPPEIYSRDPAAARRFWDISTLPPLPVAVRYTGEYFAADMTGFLADYKTPTLVLQPAFDEGSVNEFLEAAFTTNWRDWTGASHPHIAFKTIDDAHAFLWIDNPAATFGEIDKFLNE